MYRVDYYILRINPKTFEPDWENIHSVFVDKETEAKFLCEAFNGAGTKAKYIEVEE